MSKSKKSTLASLALCILVGRIPFKKKVLRAAIVHSRKARGVYLIFRIASRLARSKGDAEFTIITKEALIETH